METSFQPESEEGDTESRTPILEETRSEQRQKQVIRQLQERNRQQKLAEKKEQLRLESIRKQAQSAVGLDQEQIKSRLFEPKRKSLKPQDEALGEDSRPEDRQIVSMVKKFQDEGPNPRHADFLKKLAEQSSLKKQEEQDKETKQRRLKEKLAKKHLNSDVVRLSLAERIAQLEEKRAEEAARRLREEEEAKSQAPKSSLVPSVWKKHLVQSESKSDDPARLSQERSYDRARWAQKHGISEDTQVFICSNGYPAIREELLRRGWHENKDVESDHFDLMFTMKLSPLLNRELREDQIINRFLGTGEMCSKAGISRNLKSVKWFESADPDTFYPRCYNLGLTDGSELQEFIEDFRVTAAERLLKIFRDMSENGKKPVRACPYVIATATRVCSKLVQRYNDEYVDSPSMFVPPVVSCVEWAIIKASEKNLTLPEDLLGRLRADSSRESGAEFMLRTFMNASEENLSETCRATAAAALEPDAELVQRERAVRRYSLQHVKRLVEALAEGLLQVHQVDLSTTTQALEVLAALEEFRNPSQSRLNGQFSANAWIVKPGGKSRGRGIACFNNLEALLKYTRANTQETTSWVVQKYMENSLIVHKRKFDIRQWVMVTSWNPLIIYFYDECYLRFCVNEYSLESKALSDRFSHLANNSISKESSKIDQGPIGSGSMWSRDQFIEYLRVNSIREHNVWQQSIQPAMEEIVRMSLGCVQDLVTARANSFEIFGFDFMLDDQLNPWLIEINSSPSMEYSTIHTERMVKEALTSSVACFLDARYKTTSDGIRKLRSKPDASVDTGKWKLIHHGTQLGHKMDLKDLNVAGSGIAQYNRNLDGKKKFYLPKKIFPNHEEKEGDEEKGTDEEKSY